MTADITNRQDIEMLVNRFYELVQTDELLSPVFAHVDWPHHLPVMYNFWSSVIFGEQSYKGNPFQKHRDLLLEDRHFGRWLELFTLTVDGLFHGPNAEEIKSRARSIGAMFLYKLGLAQHK